MQKQAWQSKIAYQIYPKSFLDTNADGIGDLPGVLQKLDYLHSLGVGLLWLSPVYPSPLADQGYDIADYYGIDPRFGSMADMERLIAEAKKRDIGIIMDLVLNHCSDEHPWFEAALRDPTGPYADYFYFRPGKPDGSPPTNWRAYFGGSAWEPVPGTDLYYLHYFHKKQPDLNWENPAVRQQLYKMVNWWQDKGLAGFRLDAITNIKKPEVFHDYPADRPDGSCSVFRACQDSRGLGAFLRELRANTFAPHGTFTVGEVFDDHEGGLAEFAGEDGYFSTIFDFAQDVLAEGEDGWDKAAPVTAESYKASVFASQAQAEGTAFLANITENHDEPRGVSIFIPQGECDERAKKLLATILMLRRGLPFLYQGQEIGMENVEYTSIEQADDISTRGEYEGCLQLGYTPQQALEIVMLHSRDNARTPMQWSAAPEAGFTAGKPWLAVNPNYPRINVAEQETRADSLLHYYRALAALRQSAEYGPCLVWGAFTPVLAEQKNLLAFYRTGEGKRLLVLTNYQTAAQTVQLPCRLRKLLLNNAPEAPKAAENGQLTLQGYQALVYEVEL